MSRFITTANIAVFEYPPVDAPVFDFKSNGELFIHGYTEQILGKTVRCAKRFELPTGYTMVGRYSEAVNLITGDFTTPLAPHNLDLDNCLVFALTPSDNN